MAVNDLLTLVEARSAVNLPAGAGAHDADLQLFVSGLSRRVDQLCGSVVIRTVTAERHDGGTHRIWLEKSPASSITSVSEWLDTTQTVLAAETDGVKPADAYLLGNTGPLSFIRRRNAGTDARFARGRENVVATYQAGRYADTASVDSLFKLAAGAILRRIWKREQSSWAQAPDFFPDTEDPRPGLQFFKAVDPMITEFLADELLPPPAGL